MRTPNNQLPSVARLMRADQMLMAGEGVDSVARQLGISTASAKRYKAIIEESGIDALENMGVADENRPSMRRHSNGLLIRFEARRQPSGSRPTSGLMRVFNHP